MFFSLFFLSLSPDISSFPKWERIVLTQPPGQVLFIPDDKKQAVEQVHLRYKNMRHIEDTALHGEQDLWASPRAFKALKMGDCEDFAIAKYYDLLTLGFYDSDLRIIIGRKKKNSRIHAVLAVRVGKEILVLDNEKPRQVMPESHLETIEKAYEINRLGWAR